MLEVNLDTSSLMKWARHFEQMPGKTKPAIARALNHVGENIVFETARYLSQQSGIETEALTPLFKVKQATATDLVWELDANAVKPPSGDWSRPWDTNKNMAFEQSTLVQILTREDKDVCEICAEAAANGPYTYEEALKLFAHGFPGELGLHPRCRCLLQSFSSTRRLDVSFGQMKGTSSPFVSRSLRTLGAEVAKELSAVLKVV